MHIINSKRGHGKAAKIWIDTLEVMEKGNLSLNEIRLAQKLIASNKSTIIQHIKDFSKGKKHKSIELKLK